MTAAARTPIVLDVDTGVDDACALLLAALHPGLDLRAVTCVGGNAPLADVVRNTLSVLDTCGREDVPVGGRCRPCRCSSRPATRGTCTATTAWATSTGRARHAQVGRPPRRGAAARRAARGGGRRRTPVTLVPLAPMTNIALLLRTHPEVASGIRRIVFMGGAAHVGNATASAEFNVFHDPEAAAITLDACTDLGIELVMYGLDVFYDPRVTRRAGRGAGRRGRAPDRRGWPDG